MLNEHEKERVRELRQMHFSMLDISRRMKVSMYSVREYCNEVGIGNNITYVKRQFHPEGKYDYKFNEPIAKGKNYAEYRKS